MDPLTILAAISAIGTVASAGAGYAANQRNEKYKSQQDEFNKKVYNKNVKDEKKAALARALGITDPIPQKPRNLLTPKAPGMGDLTLAKGLSDVVGQLSALGYARSSSGPTNPNEVTK